MHNSVATLLNSAFVIKKNEIEKMTDKYIKIKGYCIEKEVLRNAASPRNYALNREEYIIFPYKYLDGTLIRYEEREFKDKFPGTYKYLMSISDKLRSRKAEKSAKWFEYGRNQALTYLNQEKILISSVLTNEVKTFRLEKDTIPYSGFFIIPISDKSLDEAEKILKSDEFLSYILTHGINAKGKSIRISVNDILNYPIICE